MKNKHLTFHLQYKHSGTFANRKNGELSYPKNPKMCDPILLTLLKMRPPRQGYETINSFYSISTYARWRMN